MSACTILQANFVCMARVPHVPATLSKSSKRWQAAFAKIYCCRTISSLAKNPTARRGNNQILLSSSYTVVKIEQENESFAIDPTSLTDLVKEKNLDQLRNLGGIPNVVAALKTDPNGGIPGNAIDLAGRHETFGSNTYKKPPSKHFFHFVSEALQDLTILILLGCAVLSLAFGIKEHGLKDGAYEGGNICVAVFLFIVVSVVSKYRQNRQFDKLSEVIYNIQTDVVRNGRRQQISIFEIVVGDIIFLKIGDQVPADGLFLDGHSLQMDESSTTGESDHVQINSSENPFLFSGSKVVDGYGRMLATSVGMNTSWGHKMSQTSGDTNEQMPIQARVKKLTSLVGKVGMAVAFLVLVVSLLVGCFTRNITVENGDWVFNGRKAKFYDVVNAVFGIVVVDAIPEGLPLAVTLTLAYSMKKMMADQAVVRKHSAFETMGSVTIICTDKTGILTENQMKVKKFWLGQEALKEGAAYSLSPKVVELIQQGVALNTTGSVCREKSGSDFEFSGSPTEKAILSWAALEMNMDMEAAKKSCIILQAEAFNSQTKRSGVMIRQKTDNTIHVHWKGAAEMILAMCSSYCDATGNMKHLDDGEKDIFERIIQSMAASGLRCIAFAHKQVSEEEHEHIKEEKKINQRSLNLLGLMGMKDPCRSEVKKAVEDCQRAGVNIKMITGDNVFTAKSIATECGILNSSHENMPGAVVEGEEFRKCTRKERTEKVDKICVMARSSPYEKLLMVQCLKEKGHVVAAITGDGTNDEPVLKEADIGLSMGIHGTQVAKGSSDIVILDDNFASVATVLRWARCFYSNIKKFIQFQLTVNISALVINFVTVVSSGQVLLKPVQLLWVNLIMDTLGALALSKKPPTKELMNKPPLGLTEPLITNVMWRSLLSQAFYQIVVLLTLHFGSESVFHVNQKVKDTLIVNTFVFCQVFNTFNARKLEKRNIFEGIHKNKLFLGITGIFIVLQGVMVEFIGRFGAAARLNWGQLGACIGIAAVSWPIGWIVKCIPVPRKPFLSYFK